MALQKRGTFVTAPATSAWPISTMPFTWASLVGIWKLIHFTRFGGKAKARVRRNARRLELLRLEGQDLHRHLRHDAEAPAKSGEAPEEPPQVRAGPVAPEGIVADGKGAHLHELSIGQHQLGAEDTPVGQAYPVGKGRPAVADQVRDDGGLGAAATDDPVAAVVERLLLERGIDDARADHRIQVLFVDLVVVQPLQVDEELVLHVAVGTGSVKARAVRHVRHFVAVADLDDPLHLFRVPRQDNHGGIVVITLS